MISEYLQAALERAHDNITSQILVFFGKALCDRMPSCPTSDRKMGNSASLS